MLSQRENHGHPQAYHVRVPVERTTVRAHMGTPRDRTGRTLRARDQRGEVSGQDSSSGGGQIINDTSISNLDIVVNDVPPYVDSLAILANDTLALASRTGRRSDARA